MVGLLCAAGVGAARGDSFTGAGWAVRFNRPDQTTVYSSVGMEEYVLREALLARIDALRSNDWGCLATYTFSGNTAELGAAGPILAAVSNALGRGARMGFVADYGVDITNNYGTGTSLTRLAARAGNALALSQAPSDGGIMHDKVGVFWQRGSTQGWVVAGSWNFTGGASSQQWNLMAEIQDNALAGAYSNEMREMLSGRFHGSAAKSHAHDGRRFRLAGMERDGWVRFGPHPDGAVGGSNALTDVVAAIDAATNEIVFALNKLTCPEVVAALIRACDRGVAVVGTIPKSDRAAPSGDSYASYRALVEPTNYATANRAWMLDAYTTEARATYDETNRDLTHAKCMAIDARGAAPLAILGSANWTASGLLATNQNDENVLFLPHGGIAAAVVAQFDAMTDGTVPWCRLRSQGASSPLLLTCWLPNTNGHELVAADRVSDVAVWTNGAQRLAATRGFQSIPLARDAERRFYRIRPVP